MIMAVKEIIGSYIYFWLISSLSTSSSLASASASTPLSPTSFLESSSVPVDELGVSTDSSSVSAKLICSGLSSWKFFPFTKLGLTFGEDFSKPNEPGDGGDLALSIDRLGEKFDWLLGKIWWGWFGWKPLPCWGGKPLRPGMGGAVLGEPGDLSTPLCWKRVTRGSTRGGVRFTEPSLVGSSASSGLESLVGEATTTGVQRTGTAGGGLRMPLDGVGTTPPFCREKPAGLTGKGGGSGMGEALGGRRGGWGDPVNSSRTACDKKTWSTAKSVLQYLHHLREDQRQMKR